jgi:hypothetical protein
VQGFDFIASTKDFFLQLWKGDMKSCSDYLASDFAFVGPFDGATSVGISKFVELRVRVQPLFQHIEYKVKTCQQTYSDTNTSIGLVITLVTGDTMQPTKVNNIVVWKTTSSGVKLAQLHTYIPMRASFLDADHFHPAYSSSAPVTLPTWDQRPLVMKDSSGRNHVVNPAKTGYLEAQHQYCMVHTSPEPFRMRESLTNALDRFPSYFVRVHRSYAVNALLVSSIGKDDISLVNGEKVPIPARQSANIRSLILGTISEVLGATALAGNVYDSGLISIREEGEGDGFQIKTVNETTPPQGFSS